MSANSLLKWLYLLYICHFASCGLSIKLPISNSNKNPPEIALAGYVEVDRLRVTEPDQNFLFKNLFQNDLISKNGTDYIVSDGINEVVFSCKAGYPITWTFPFKENLPYKSLFGLMTADYRTSAFSSDVQEPFNAQFQSLLIIQLQRMEFLSTNLTCKSLEIHPEHQSSIYVYMDGKNELEQVGETLNVTYTLPAPNQVLPLTIPCRPSSPDLNVLLEIENPTKQEWKPVTNMPFDPKIGFTLPDINNLKIGRAFAIFRCSVVTDSDDKNLQSIEVPDKNNYVFFNVSSSNTNTGEDLNFQPISILRGTASVDFENSQPALPPNKKIKIKIKNKHHYSKAWAQTLVSCCSGVPEKPPILFTQNCYTPLQCELQKQAIPGTFQQFEMRTKAAKPIRLLPQTPLPKKANQRGCAKTWMFSPSAFVICKGENVNFIQQYNNVFSPLSVGPVANRNKRFPSDNTTKAELGVSLTEYTPATTVTPLSQKIMMFVGRRVNDTLVFQTTTAKVGPPIVFQHKEKKPLDNTAIDNALALQSVIGRIRDNLKRISVTVLEYDRDVYYEGEPLMFLCVGAKIFYAKGPHLRLNWQNGSKTVLETGDDDDTASSQNRMLLKIFYLSGGDSIFRGGPQNMEYVFAKTITATKGMSSVDCWMPPLGSSKWDKVSKTVKVLPSVPPLFSEPEEETVYFYLGGKNNEVRCTIIQGLPTPIMTVLRDGKKQVIPWKTQKSTLKQGSSKASDESVDVDKEKHKMKIRFDFSSIQHGHQGKVECIAKNANSTVTRTVHIFVIEKPSVALPISLSLVGILSLVLVGLGLKQWYDRRSVLSCRPSNSF